MAPDSELKAHWFQILLAVTDTRRHGSGIRDEVLRQTEGRMRLWPTSLYGSLKHLVEKGHLRETPLEGTEGDGDRRRFYEITDSGREALARELRKLTHTIAIAASKQAPAGS